MGTLFRSSLQRRIVFIVALGALLMFAALAVTGWLAVRESIDRALKERLGLAQATADHLEYVLNQNLGWLENIAYAPGVDLEDQDLAPEKLALHNAYLHSIFDERVYLLDEEGVVLWTEPYHPQLLGQNMTTYEHVAQSMHTGKPAVSNLFTAQPAGKAQVSAVTPIKKGGRLVALVGGDIDLTGDRLLQVIQPARMGQTGYIEIVDGEGLVLASTRRENLLTHSDHEDQLKNLIKERDTTIGTCHTCHEEAKETEVMAFAPLSPSYVSWGIIIREAEAEALAPAGSMQRQFTIFGVSLLAIALFLAWGTGRSLVRPLRTLTAAARRISSGNLSTPIEAQGQDEIGVLSRTLDEMRERLQASYLELDRWNRELEDRVQQRTKESLALVRASQTLAMHSLDLDSLLGTITQAAVDTIAGADAGTLFLYDQEKGKLLARSAAGYRLESLARVELSPGEAMVGKAFASATPQVYNSPQEVAQAMADLTPQNKSLLETARQGMDPRSAITAPLEYKGRVLGGLVLVNLNSGGAFSPAALELLSAFAAQAAVAIENATLYEEVQRKEAIRGDLLRKVISAQEEERKRIARELHDDISQDLAALTLATDAAALPPTIEGEQLQSKLSNIKSLALRTMDSLHQMILDLRPSVLDDLGLLPTLRWYAETRLDSLGVRASLETKGNERRLPGQIELTLFRVAQEAITNVARHAEATNVFITVDFQDSAVTLEVEDDGKGFEVSTTGQGPAQGRGLGLMGMRERIDLLGGSLAVHSEPGSGTRLEVKVPLPQEDASDG